MSDYSLPVLFPDAPAEKSWKLWGDFETTGIDPTEHEILEVGFILESPTGETLADLAILVREPDRNLEDLWAKMPPVVREMHEVSGLWEDLCADGAPTYKLHEVDFEIMVAIDALVPTDARVQLAGSGVGRFDRAYIAQYLPFLDNRLHYRELDISSMREGFIDYGLLKYVDMPNVQHKTHRALADAEMHRQEYRAMMDFITAHLPGNDNR